MIPEDRLSTTSLETLTLYKVKSAGEYLKDYELAGVDLNDPSQGLLVKEWTLTASQVGASWAAKVVAPGVSQTTLFTRTGIVEEVALSFDQNMRPMVAFTDSTGQWLWWFDTSVGSQVFTEFPDARQLRLTLDERRELNLANSDVLLSYINSSDELCVRYQRDRFLTEYVLASVPNVRLVYMARNTALRVQWMLTGD